MTQLLDDLVQVIYKLSPISNKLDDDSYMRPLQAIVDACEEIKQSWSQSQLGYQANVYHGDFSPPPPGAYFSIEWGFMSTISGGGTTGDWHTRSGEEVRAEIDRLSGRVNLEALYDADFRQAASLFEEAKEELLSITGAYVAESSDEYIVGLRAQIEKEEYFSWDSIVKNLMHTGPVMTRDVRAGQTLRSAAFQEVLASVLEIRARLTACGNLAKIADRARRHIARTITPESRVSGQLGTNVFIGHGRSPLWRELKDFISERLKLPYDEFNRVPVAGITNIDRLGRMLDEAAVAFLVLTAEDERSDGSTTARMNVVHEVGLFQGRLGFGRAIVMLEEGCEEFSNIQGLGQIRFPAGRISAVFESVRELLEREGLIGD